MEVDWWVQRIAVSKIYGGLDPNRIRTRWSWRDVVHAHMMIDAFERAGAEV